MNCFFFVCLNILFVVLSREVRLAVPSNGLANSYSHDVLPHVGGVAGMPYAADLALDEIRSDVSVESFHQAQSSYRRTSSSGNQVRHQAVLHSHSNSAVAGSNYSPSHQNHYRSVSMGGGTKGGVPVSALVPAHSQSSDLGQSWPLTTTARAGGGGVVPAGEIQRTPPQRRVNYVRQEIKPQNSLGKVWLCFFCGGGGGVDI